MPRSVHAFEHPERFVAGTVGQPGERTFYLQARDGARVVSVALEKVQVQLLAEKLTELLAEAPGPFIGRYRPGRRRTARHPDRGGVPRRHPRPRVGRRPGPGRGRGAGAGP